MKVYELIEATEMSRPNMYDKKNRDYGSRKKYRKEKVTLKDTGTGKVYGKKEIKQNNT